MKQKLLSALGIAAVLCILSFGLGTGGLPADDTLVYFNPSRTIYFPPTRTPANAGYIPTSYAEAVRSEAKPDDQQGFTFDGPPLPIYLLEAWGVIAPRPRHWSRTKTALEVYSP